MTSPFDPTDLSGAETHLLTQQMLEKILLNQRIINAKIALLGAAHDAFLAKWALHDAPNAVAAADYYGAKLVTADLDKTLGAFATSL